jgi:hypothetical protein
MEIDMGPFLSLSKIVDVTVQNTKTSLRIFKTIYSFYTHFNGVNNRMKLEVERGTEINGKKTETLFLFLTGMGVLGKPLRDTDKVLIGTAKYKLLHLEKYLHDILVDTEEEEDDIEEFSD